MDLSPRSTTLEAVPPAAGRPRSRNRNRTVVVLLAVLLFAGGFILFQGLSSAKVYFCNADEVGRRSDCGGVQRFRLQGTVETGSVKQQADGVDFTVFFNGTSVPVHHVGDPGGIFKEGIPVVVEGRLVSGTFQSDLLMVKHSEQYIEKNPNRVPAGAP